MLLSLPCTPLGFAASTAKHACGDFSSLSVGDHCEAEWSELRDVLRPTQRAVGYAWVFHVFLKDMQSKGDTQDAMDSKIVPVTLGPNGTAYIIDHHHHLAALDLSGHKTVKVTLFVSCDFSSVAASQQLPALASARSNSNPPNALAVTSLHRLALGRAGVRLPVRQAGRIGRCVAYHGAARVAAQNDRLPLFGGDTR